jgi:hypothetical protein
VHLFCLSSTKKISNIFINAITEDKSMSGTNRGLNKLEQAQYFWNQGRFREAGDLYRNMLLENPELARSGLSINLAHSIILATDWSDVSKIYLKV